MEVHSSKKNSPAAIAKRAKKEMEAKKEAKKEARKALQAKPKKGSVGRPKTKPENTQRVSADLEPDFHHEFKVRAMENKTSMTDLLTEFIELYNAGKLDGLLGKNKGE